MENENAVGPRKANDNEALELGDGKRQKVGDNREPVDTPMPTVVESPSTKPHFDVASSEEQTRLDNCSEGDHYQVLELASDCGEEEIKKAFSEKSTMVNQNSEAFRSK
jgi:hypothetical protein